jgi:superfamily II DNA or RNA helicase
LYDATARRKPANVINVKGLQPNTQGCKVPSFLCLISILALMMDTPMYSRNDGLTAPVAPNDAFRLRGYQAEMVEESMKANIIVVMDTGSGKTHM